jgi:hypothetical protein
MPIFPRQLSGYDAKRDRYQVATGHKAFDRYCSYITYGNIHADGQYGNFIRAFTETRCNGFTFSPGYLRDSDLRTFKEEFRLPAHVLAAVLRDTHHDGGVLYVFWHGSKYSRRGRTVHGYLLTGRDELYTLRWLKATGPTCKSWNILDWCKDFISNPPRPAYAGEGI